MAEPILPDIEAVSAPALEMRGITKRYPGVVANDHIDLTVRPGEIHALLGENGAGKSTLMNILYGLAKPDEGEILLDGAPLVIKGPTDAIHHGINMVHQHFMLIPVLTVADNILLGEEAMRGRIFLDRREARQKIRELGTRFGFEIDPDELVSRLSVGWQQRVEILKALYRDARILVLDEPTAVLTPQETQEIFLVLRRLAERGHSIVFISHKLYEVMEIADRITVIRRGKVVGERLPAETDEDDLAELMVGREVQLTVDRGQSHPADVTLAVKDLVVKGDRGRVAVDGVTLDVRAGEILGIAGVAGNGQDELVEAIVGLRRPTSGTISLKGADVTTTGPRDLHEQGVAFVPADRHRFGVILPWPITDNLVLTDYYAPPYSRGRVRNDQAVADRAVEAIEQFDIRTPSPTLAVGALSGGNQQKVVVAREFDRELSLLVLDQPTRGLDVGSVEFIHRQAIAKRDAGTAILLVSAELDEVLELSDRIAVMYRGKVVATLDGRTAQKDEVGLMMATGVARAGEAAAGTAEMTDTPGSRATT
jgi:general nucleoside transport system ATP-binding protein